jgi:hypothetical protein
MKNSIFKSILVIVIALSSSYKLYSQTNDLTASDIVQFKVQVGVMIDAFQNGLSIIASKGKSQKTKENYIKTTLELFMGDGEKYLDYEDGTEKQVMMEVSSLYRTPRIRTITLKSYVYSLSRLPYAIVEVTSADNVMLSNFYKQGDRYVATATIFQRFCGYQFVEGKKTRVYCDMTQKMIKVYLYKEVTIFGENWAVRLGDTKVDDTSPAD